MLNRGNQRRRSAAPSERGAALVELAIALPLLAVILVGTIDFGRVFRATMVVTDAARAGAQWGSHSTINAVNTAGMISRADAVLTDNGLNVGGPTTAEYRCACLNDSGGLVGGASVACNTVCVGSHLVVNVTVTASRTFSLINPFPGIPSSLTITRGSTMRVVQ